MQRPTQVTKRYDPPTVSFGPRVDVKIKVEGLDDGEALALADALYNAVEDTHGAFEG